MSAKPMNVIELPYLPLANEANTLRSFAPVEEWRPLRRWSVDIPAIVRIAGEPHDCDVHNLSPTGARVLVSGAGSLAPGMTLDFEMDGFDPIPATVRYMLGGYMGIRFQYNEAEKANFARRLRFLRPPRRPRRQVLNREALLTVRGTELKAQVRDLSERGANLSTDDKALLMEGDEVTLKIAGYDEVAATVRRIGNGQVGLMFLEDLNGKWASYGSGQEIL